MSTESTAMDVDCVAVDNSWGPWAGQCRGGLDFTLLFEECVLSIVPNALLFLVLPLYVSRLRGRTKKTAKGILLPVKQALIAILGLLRIGFPIFWVLTGQRQTRTTLAAAVVNALVVLALCLLSYYEHIFRVAPSLIVEFYLLVTIGLDIARVRTLWLLPGATAVATVDSASLIVKIVLSWVEGINKSGLILEHGTTYTSEQLSGLYGRSLFLWLGSTLWNGFHRFLDASDLFGPRDEEASEVLRERFRQCWALPASRNGKMALFITLVKAMPEYFLIPFIPKLAVVAITLTQPLLLRRMIEFVQGEGYDNRPPIGYALVGAFALMYGLTAVLNGWFAHACNRLSLEIRSQLIDATYRHMLKLRLSALDTGNATTLINVDMQHIMDGSLILHDIWASTLTLGIAVYLLYREIGLAFLAPLLCALVITVAGGGFGPALSTRQVAWLASTEKRVKSTMLMVSSFKELKMLGLSQTFLHNLQKLRLNEVQVGKHFRRIISIVIALSAASTQLSILATYGGFAIISKIHNIPLTTETLFASLALLRISLDPLFLLIQGTPSLVSMFKCLNRIQNLLNDTRQLDGPFSDSEASSSKFLVDVKPAELDIGLNSLPSSLLNLVGYESFTSAPPLVEMSDATFTWKEGEKPALHVSNLSIEPCSFSAVIGSVGCGKSTLLKAILGEVEQTSGFRRIRPKLVVAYCDQEPWLLDLSIKENIVGPLPYNQDWYNIVMDACALTPDISLLPKGDSTGVGSGGSAMSGGQRSRIALARAIYCKPDLILLDDIFSGLDRKSTQHIFSSLFSHTGLLSKLHCAVMLSTHSTQFLPRFETIIVLENGAITRQAGYYELLSEGIVSSDSLSGTRGLFSEPDSKPTKDEADSPKNQGPDEDKMDNSRIMSEWSVYIYFLRACGLWGMGLFLVLAAVLAAERSFENVWLKMWAESTTHSLTYYITLFAALIVGGLALLYGLCVFFFDFLLVSSSLKLYFKQLETLMKSSISYVVSVGSTTIANRFIQDIMLIDDELPMSLVNTTTALLGTCAECVIVFISSKYVSASVPVLIGLLWIVQKFYLRTSKQLRLLDIEAKAPLSAFMLETIQGIVSIRAFNRRADFTLRNSGHLDHSQRAMYMFLSVQVWLKMILDFVVCLLAILVTTLAVVFRTSQSPGFLGLALVNLISLSTSFKYLITFWAQLETSIGAVARIKRFNEEVEPEEKGELPAPYVDWPDRGEIDFQHVSATYSPKMHPALQDISLHINPGTKVAVCGRSGGGKSSLLGSLLRCLDLTSGTVVIDGQDITRITRDSVRERIMTLPQKSLFIHASIRDNMTLWTEDDSISPEERDSQIEAVLRKVGIWEALFTSRKEKKEKEAADKKEGKTKSGTKKEKKHKKKTGHPPSNEPAPGEENEKRKEEYEAEEEPITLDSTLDPEERLSTGQQQLFCLARALFQRSSARIVLMDEFTSSMDQDTEALVRQVVREELGNRTIIEVLHRLENIMDFDMVLVVDKGRIVESGNPEELLGREGGRLQELYKASSR